MFKVMKGDVPKMCFVVLNHNQVPSNLKKIWLLSVQRICPIHLIQHKSQQKTSDWNSFLYECSGYSAFKAVTEKNIRGRCQMLSLFGQATDVLKRFGSTQILWFILCCFSLSFRLLYNTKYILKNNPDYFISFLLANKSKRTFGSGSAALNPTELKRCLVRVQLN